MKKNNSRIRITGYIISCFCLFISCSKQISIDNPSNVVIGKAVFSTDEAAIAATVGMYAQMHTLSLSAMNGGNTLYMGLASDELIPTSVNVTAESFSNNALQASLTPVRSLFWLFCYNLILHANSIIEGLQVSHSISPDVKQQILGEAYFIRGFMHFWLVNVFGDVPIILSTEYEKNSTVPRESVTKVYAQVESDLQNSLSHLTDTYPSAAKARPNKWTVVALLARVYLYQKKWAEAEQSANSIITGSGNYTLMPAANINGIFQVNSTETIWQLQPTSTVINTTEGNLFNPTSATVIPTYALTPLLVNSFEAGDQRQTSWIGKNVNNGKEYFYPRKYKVKGAAPPYTEYNVVFRLTEQYLIRAEARAELDNLSGAKSDLDLIRGRAGLAQSAAITKTDILDAILKERRHEFFAEWGHRWYDLKRAGKIDDVLGLEKPGKWQHDDALFPIPELELSTNPYLIQNPGY